MTTLTAPNTTPPNPLAHTIGGLTLFGIALIAAFLIPWNELVMTWLNLVDQAPRREIAWTLAAILIVGFFFAWRSPGERGLLPGILTGMAFTGLVILALSQGALNSKQFDPQNATPFHPPLRYAWQNENSNAHKLAQSLQLRPTRQGHYTGAILRSTCQELTTTPIPSGVVLRVNGAPVERAQCRWGKNELRVR